MIRFVKSITRTTTQLETLLKVGERTSCEWHLYAIKIRDQGQFQDPSAGFITNYIVLIGDAVFPNFQKARSKLPPFLVV